jgi:hypothetical protein
VDQRTTNLGGCLQVSILATNEDIQAASSTNLSHALNYALLCLPEKFSEHDLYMVRAVGSRMLHTGI